MSKGRNLVARTANSQVGLPMAAADGARSASAWAWALAGEFALELFDGGGGFPCAFQERGCLRFLLWVERVLSPLLLQSREVCGELVCRFSLARCQRFELLDAGFRRRVLFYWGGCLPSTLARRSEMASISRSMARIAAVWVRWRASFGLAHLWNSVRSLVSVSSMRALVRSSAAVMAALVRSSDALISACMAVAMAVTIRCSAAATISVVALRSSSVMGSLFLGCGIAPAWFDYLTPLRLRVGVQAWLLLLAPGGGVIGVGGP